MHDRGHELGRRAAITFVNSDETIRLYGAAMMGCMQMLSSAIQMDQLEPDARGKKKSLCCDLKH